MFNSDNTGVLISVGITFLLCGIILFFVRNRLNVLEKAQIEQAQVLHNFINHMQEREQIQQNNMQYTQQEPSQNNNFDTQIEKVNNENGNDNMFQTEDPKELIDVSDGSSSYDSDNESDTDSSNSDEEPQILNIGNIDDLDNNIKVIEMNEQNNIKQDIEEIPLENVSGLENLEEDSTSSSDESSQEEDKEADKEEVQELIVNKLSTLNLKGLKVNELRDMVIEKGLSENKENIKTMKKKELMDLLESE